MFYLFSNIFLLIISLFYDLKLAYQSEGEGGRKSDIFPITLHFANRWRHKLTPLSVN